MNTQSIPAALEFLTELKEFRPMILQIVNEIEKYGPDIHQILNKMSLSMVDIKAAMIKKYQKEGFTRKEAILLTIDSATALQKAFSVKSSSK